MSRNSIPLAFMSLDPPPSSPAPLYSPQKFKMGKSPRPADFETGKFRKDLKKSVKSELKFRQSLKHSPFPGGYTVTCLLEIHAQLNCPRKLFS